MSISTALDRPDAELDEARDVKCQPTGAIPERSCYPEMKRSFWKARDAVFIAIGSFGVAASTFFLTRLYATRYQPEAFSAFLYFRICSSFLVAVCALGMPVALQRAVAYLRRREARASAASLVGVVLGTGGTVLACAAAALLAPWLSGRFEGYDSGPLWQAVMLLTVGQVHLTLIANVQMSRGSVLEAVGLTLVGYVLAPFLALLALPQATLAVVIAITGILTGIVALPSTWRIIVWASKHSLHSIRHEAQQLLAYGLPRIIANTSELLLELLPLSLLFLFGSDLLSVGRFAIGFTILRLLNPVSVTLQQLLVPSTAFLAASRNQNGLHTQTRQVAEGALQVGLLVTALLLIWLDAFVTLWLGPDYPHNLPLLRILLISLAPIFVFNSVRGILDGAVVYPHNTINVLLALCTMTASVFAGRLLGLGIEWIAWSYTFARLLLAILSLRDTLRYSQLSLFELRQGSVLVTVSLLVLLNLGARELFRGHPWDMVVFPVACIATSLVFTYAMSLCDAAWAKRVVALIPIAR